MRSAAHSDHLASSLTDLVTSLMVIFILLLLVFINNRASQQAVVVRDLMKDLQVQFKDGGGVGQGPLAGGDGAQEAMIQRDVKDPGTLLFIVPERVMNFAVNESRLKAEGVAFIQARMPQLARILCSEQFQPHIDAIIVEGHTDQTRPSHLPASQGEQWNLRLSQDRSMEVVKQSLMALESQPAMRGFFLAKLSASGRGESEPARPDATAEENRRVVFKIRVKSDRAQAAIGQAMNQQAMASQTRPNW